MRKGREGDGSGFGRGDLDPIARGADGIEVDDDLLAVGGGQGSWDIDGLPAEDKERTQLYNEIARVAVVMNYLDESNEPTLTVTRHIDLAATFGSGVGEAASWREWAVFGGNATGSANSGIIIDLRLHTALPKVSQTWVRRTRFFF